MLHVVEHRLKSHCWLKYHLINVYEHEEGEGPLAVDSVRHPSFGSQLIANWMRLHKDIRKEGVGGQYIYLECFFDSHGDEGAEGGVHWREDPYYDWMKLNVASFEGAV